MTDVNIHFLNVSPGGTILVAGRATTGGGRAAGQDHPGTAVVGSPGLARPSGHSTHGHSYPDTQDWLVYCKSVCFFLHLLYFLYQVIHELMVILPVRHR